MNVTVLGEATFPSPLRRAVHAAMAGKTGVAIGLLHDTFIHVPIDLLAKQKKQLDPDGPAWHAVLATTGQPARFE
jgi:6-phosphofructokinase 1